MSGSHIQRARSGLVDALALTMLTKTESAQLLLLINAYANAVVSSVADTDMGRRIVSVDKAARALERLLEYVEEIS